MPLQSPQFAQNQRLQAAANNSPPLRSGSSGDAVAALQTALIHFGYDMPSSTMTSSGDPDGIYGDETVATVQQFQTDQGLSADGIAGHDTLTQLDQMYSDEFSANIASQFLDARNCYLMSRQKGI